MKEREQEPTSWPLIFLLVAISFLGFSFVVKWLDGSPSHSILFLRIGFVASVLAAISFFRQLKSKEFASQRKRR